MSDHQPKETAKAAAAFLEYCLLEDRSLAKLAKSWRLENGNPAANLRQLEEWSRQHDWVERARQYDSDRASERRRKRDAEIEKMDEEHAIMSHAMAIRAVDLLKRRIEAGDIGAYALVQLFDKATALERLARGAPTERTEQTGPEGGPLQAIFYLPKVEQEEGGDANAYSDDL